MFFFFFFFFVSASLTNSIEFDLYKTAEILCRAVQVMGKFHNTIRNGVETVRGIITASKTKIRCGGNYTAVLVFDVSRF